MRGVSRFQSPDLEHPLQLDVLLNSSEYFSLYLVGLSVGLIIEVGMGPMISRSISSMNLVRLFLEPQLEKRAVFVFLTL